MATGIYDVLVPALLRGLAVLRSYVDKAEATTGTVCTSEDHYLKARLAQDMDPFLSQVQRASDTAKGAVARLAGVAGPVFPDNEATASELRDRIDRTIAYVNSFGPRDFIGADARMIDQRFRSAPFAMRGDEYLVGYVLPAFHFHIAMAHAILRHHSVVVGKADYLGQVHGSPVATAGKPAPRVRFLGESQGNAWLRAYGMLPISEEERCSATTSLFSVNFSAVSPPEVISALVGDDGLMTRGALLRFTDWIWDDEYEADPTAPVREKYGEERDLSTVPCWVFPPERMDTALALLEIVLVRNWNAILYLPDARLTVQFYGEGDAIVLSADDIVEDAVRYRLIELGIQCNVC
jgi:hypothetical protein